MEFDGDRRGNAVHFGGQTLFLNSTLLHRPLLLSASPQRTRFCSSLLPPKISNIAECISSFWLVFSKSSAQRNRRIQIASDPLPRVCNSRRFLIAASLWYAYDQAKPPLPRATCLTTQPKSPASRPSSLSPALTAQQVFNLSSSSSQLTPTP